MYAIRSYYALQSIVSGVSATGSTPLQPTMVGALNYFSSNRTDEYYGEAYEDVSCQPKILLLVTDGLGNTPSGLELSDYTDAAQDLADAGITLVCVGFGLTDASQLNAIVEIAQEAGEDSDSDYLYALHQTDSNGDPSPYLAQSRADFIEAIQTIVSAVKNQAFYGSGAVITSYSIHYTKLYEFERQSWNRR